jgi:AcrR family transcriptional regulator
VARSDTAGQILAAARSCLLAEGYSGLSTRRVADLAGVPLSQIHYHFGSRKGLVLALLDEENRRRVERQREMYGTATPLWKRYEQACDLLEDDLDSGYVRVLQEMMAAGWTDRAVADQVLGLLTAWFEVLQEVTREAQARFGTLGPLGPADVAMLIGLSFLGGESVILLGEPAWGDRVRGALRSVGDLIKQVEERAPDAVP